MAIALKERIDPYLSVRAFGLTFGGLLLASLLISALIIVLAPKPEVSSAITVPLGGEATVEEMAQPLPVGTLNPEDKQMAAPDAPPAPEEKSRPPVEDALAGLHENSPFGMVPVIRKADQMTAYKAYQPAFEALPTTKALISLVMVDYGLSKTASRQAVEKLPDTVTLALSPYAQDSQQWTTAARQDGHEVWLGLPLQSKEYGQNDTGAQTLLVNGSIETNKARLMMSLGKATGYVGVVDLDSPAFSNNAADLERIYNNITERGLALAQADTHDHLTAEYAKARKVPFIQNNLWIDEDPSPIAVAEHLKKLEQVALNGRIAVGFFHPYPAVIEAVAKWQTNLDAQSLQMAPLSGSIAQE